MILPKDRHDIVRQAQAVDMDLNTVKSPEDSSCANNVFLSPNIIPSHLAVPVVFHHTPKYLFNIWPHLIKQSLQTEFQISSLCFYLISILKSNIKFAKFSFPASLNSKQSVC